MGGLNRRSPRRKKRADPAREAGELNQPETQQSLGRTAVGGRRGARAADTATDKKRVQVGQFVFRQKIERHADPGLGDGLTRDDGEVNLFPDTGHTGAAFDRASAMARAAAATGHCHGAAWRRRRGRDRNRSKNEKAGKQSSQSVFQHDRTLAPSGPVRKRPLTTSSWGRVRRRRTRRGRARRARGKDRSTGCPSARAGPGRQLVSSRAYR